MSTPRDIYLKLEAGDHLTVAELDIGLKHFTQLTKLLAASGPAFVYATLQANSIEGKLRLFKDVSKFETLAADRESEDYQVGYRTGIVWKDTYRPGGPFVTTWCEGRDKPQHKQMCDDSVDANRRWLMGFDEGLAAKKAGHKPTADMLSCTSKDAGHVHWLPCLVGRGGGASAVCEVD